MSDLANRSISAARPLALALLTLALAACAVVVPVSRPAPSQGGGGGSQAKLGIPPGHLPPPGMCRVWFPGRPPGRQPRPVSCRSAMATAPAGSWVLYRADSREVHTRVIDSRQVGVVVQIRVYAAADGVFLRSERP